MGNMNIEKYVNYFENYLTDTGRTLVALPSAFGMN